MRPIEGVATSIAAFVGWAPRGDTDKALRVNSWGDYERLFGGLDPRSLLSYSVYHFFENGGTQAYIVRLVADDAGNAEITVDNKLKIIARNRGNWGKNYGVTVKASGNDITRIGITIVNILPGTDQEIGVERFTNLSMSPEDDRFVTKVIERNSTLVKAEILGGAITPPADTGSTSSRLTGEGNLDGVLEPNSNPFHSKLQAGGGAIGVNLLDQVDLFNLLCVPGETNPAVISDLQKFCRERRAFLIVDCDKTASFESLQYGSDPIITGENAINSAFYFPWVEAHDHLKEGFQEYPPCGFVAGVFATTDARGVWKAPAGTVPILKGVEGLRTVLTDAMQGDICFRAINCLRKILCPPSQYSSQYMYYVWGAHTLRVQEDIGSEWKYISVRRLTLFIEESLYRGLTWIVFEPNDEPLWAQIRRGVGAFMHSLFRNGAFQGSTPREAYFVKCDKETTTQNDISMGIVNIVVGFAPIKPAEFVIIKIQQKAGHI